MSDPSTKGSVVGSMTVGKTPGAHNMAQGGREQYAAGETEINAAKTQGYVEGTADRIGGKKDSVASAATGDTYAEIARQEKGERQQEWNK